MAVDMASLIRMLELRLKRQRDSLRETEEQLAAAYDTQKQKDLAAPVKR